MTLEKKMYLLKWTNRFGEEVKLTHQYEHEVYKMGEALINENKHIEVCPM